MSRDTKKNNKKSTHMKASIQELSESRNGGQIALRGYSYQFLYSCYLIISSSNTDTSFQLEGIEDIDCIKQIDGSSDVTHIQLKYSINKQDASFLSDVIENFLEAYLLDQNRVFKLVYDFPVAKGNLSKLFESNLDSRSRTHWMDVILNIKRDNPDWCWEAYDFDKFISCLSFERVEKSSLSDRIENALIETYEITTDNIGLFANSLKILCFEKMEQRGSITKSELDRQIQAVKIDISKGPQNPAHSWIRKLDYSSPVPEEASSFFEGKKATPADIVSGIPIRRIGLEKEVIDSIQINTVTVIKASSGQGKTTLALQVAHTLQSEYTAYQLLWCDEPKEIGNTVQYFKARVQLGEKILILIDNLDNHFRQWNKFAQLMQSELHRHYKVIITTREIDWYNYSGDLSSVQSVKIIKPCLEEKDAIEIFNLFKEANHLHPEISSWQQAWRKVSGRNLLIEYVYLLTHGEMLSERIASQLSEIGQSPTGKAKCEVLRKVCFADLCGVKLSVADLYTSQSENEGADFGELLKSMESEFLVHVDEGTEYIEGLHPIRSKHVVDKLHEFFPIDNTALSVIKVARKTDYPELFSHLPEFTLNTYGFFKQVVELLWDNNDLSNYILAIQGMFSGSVMKYYRSNQASFDDANTHGGLFFIATEMCPFTQFKEFEVSVNTLDDMRKMSPENKNIEYLCNLRDGIPACSLQETYVYAFCCQLFSKLLSFHFSEINDPESYAVICDWLYSIDPTFNLSSHISLNDIWVSPDSFTLETVSTLMYLSYCGNNEEYTKLVNQNLHHILVYLKHITKSHRVYIDHEKNAIHIEYILRLQEIKTANDQSVSRLKCICRTLPIFDLYCADALKPTVDLLSAYSIPDDAHKEMPKKNIVIMFRQDLTSLWNKTIMSNYEFDTVAEWMDYWLDVRERICKLASQYCSCVYRLLSGKQLGNLAREVDLLRKEFSQITTGEKLFPKEDRPFEEKPTETEGLELIRKYLQSTKNYINQFVGFLSQDKQIQKLFILNLRAAKSALKMVQDYFTGMATTSVFYERQIKLCEAETRSIEQLTMSCDYFLAHSPNKYFDKYQIADWYEASCREERENAKEQLSQLQSKYSVHFPEHEYTVEVLRYYPIIVDCVDLTAADSLFELFLGCISFTETSYDYLVVLSADEHGNIAPIALQFPRQLFIGAKKEIESESEDYSAHLTPPYPVDATPQMLACFSNDLKLKKDTAVELDSLPIGDIAEELWVYSKSVELLTEPEDSCYLIAETQKIKNGILEKLRLLSCTLPPEEVDWFTAVCDNTFSGRRFDDSSFNKVIEFYIQKRLKQAPPAKCGGQTDELS